MASVIAFVAVVLILSSTNKSEVCKLGDTAIDVVDDFIDMEISANEAVDKLDEIEVRMGSIENKSTKDEIIESNVSHIATLLDSYSFSMSRGYESGASETYERLLMNEKNLRTI